MKVTSNRLRQAVAEHATLLGALVTMPGWVVPRLLAQAGYGMLLFDWQHEPFTEASLAESIASGVSANCVCLVRTGVERWDQIGAVLDYGAHGVVVPMVRSRSDAESAVRACRYPSRGSRSVGGNRNQLLHGRDYFSAADDHVICAIQIEHIDAVAAIDEILSVSGIDAVVPGPVDLTRSMGRDADYRVMREPPRETVEGLERVRLRCLEAGVTYIPACESRTDAEVARANGNRIVLSGSDVSLLSRAAREQAMSMIGILDARPAS